MRSAFRTILILSLLCLPVISRGTVNDCAGRNDYTAAGGTAFVYTCRIFDKSHLEVIVTDTGGTATTKTVDTDYTVSGIGDAGGGSVTFGVAPTSGYKVSILLKMPITQGSTYTLNEGFPSSRVERDYDLLALQSRMQAEQIGRAPKFAKQSSTKDIAFPEPAASKYLRWNAAGTALETADATGAQGPQGEPGAGYGTIQDEASDLTQRAKVNFTGTGVACVDNAGATRTDCTINASTFTPTSADTVQNKVLDNTNSASGYMDHTAIAAPSSPAAGKVRLYAKTGTNQICGKDSAGTETCMGIASTGVSILDKSTATTEVRSTTSETDLYSYTVPANTLGTNSTLEMYLRIKDFDDNTSGNIITIRCYYGTTEVAAMVVGNGSTGSNLVGTINCNVSGAGATNAQVSAATVRLSSTNSAFASITSGLAGIAEDSTGPLALKITAEPSANHASLGIITDYGFVRLNP
jgi:hypothetical protein